MDWLADFADGLTGNGNSPAPYSVLLPKPGLLAKSNPFTLHPRSRIANWFVPDWICLPWCSRPSRRLRSRTPCTQLAPLIAGWRSTSLRFSRPLEFSPNPSSVCTIHRASASLVPQAWTSKIDRPFLQFLDYLAHQPTRELLYQLECYRTN